MKTPIALLALTASLAGSAAPAQLLILPPGPVAPGTTIMVTIINNTGTMMGLPCGNPLSMLHDDGGVIVPSTYYDCGFPFPPGASTTQPIQIPATGPGSSGSFVVRSHLAAARLDVGTPSSTFPAIHACPANTGQFWRHQASLWWTMQWAFSNTAATPHTFTSNDVVSFYSPGASIPIVTLTLSGYVVPANGTLVGDLPLSFFPQGHYTIESTWLDPGTGSVVTVRHGINKEGGRADINLPGGHVIPSGSTLPIDVNLSGFPWIGPAPVYALCIGILPGTTPAPGGLTFPLVLDTAVLASLTDGIGGLLVGNVGVASTLGTILTTWVSPQVQVTHPGPLFSGIVVRTAAFAYEPVQGLWGVSQGEDLLIQ